MTHYEAEAARDRIRVALAEQDLADARDAIAGALAAVRRAEDRLAEAPTRLQQTRAAEWLRRKDLALAKRAGVQEPA